MTILEALQKAIISPRSLSEEEILYGIPGSDEYLEIWLTSAIENWPALTEEQKLDAGQNLKLILESNLKLRGQGHSSSLINDAKKLLNKENEG